MSIILSGNVTTTPTSGSAYTRVSTASTNAAVIKNGPAQLYEVTISNPTATAMYAKFYDKASAPTVGTDVPLFTVTLAASSSASTLVFGEVGKRFTTGLAIAITAAITDADTANATAGGKVSVTYL